MLCFLSEELWKKKIKNESKKRENYRAFNWRGKVGKYERVCYFVRRYRERRIGKKMQASSALYWADSYDAEQR